MDGDSSNSTPQAKLMNVVILNQYYAPDVASSGAPAI